MFAFRSACSRLKLSTVLQFSDRKFCLFLFIVRPSFCLVLRGWRTLCPAKDSRDVGSVVRQIGLGSHAFVLGDSQCIKKYPD